MPQLPATTLTGVIACKSPNYFRLKANNPFAKADLGSNASKAWVYVKPGESAILTWDHEDTDLIQKLDLGVPFIDPNWLMLVLGITPLDASEYQLGPAPNGKPELWLTAVEQTSTGRPMKRIVKVDTVEGVVREHALYDDNNRPVVRAILSSHRPHAGYLVPGHVRLTFPAKRAELTLTFNGIETNPMLPDNLWHMPEKNVQVVDLGMLARQRLMAKGHYHSPSQTAASFASHTNQPNAASPLISQQSHQQFEQVDPSAAAGSFEEFMAAEQALQSPVASDRSRFYEPNAAESHAVEPRLPELATSGPTSQLKQQTAPVFDEPTDSNSWPPQAPFGQPASGSPSELAPPEWDDPPAKKPSLFRRLMGR